MAVQVNDPAGFPHHPKADEADALIKIQPIPLQPALTRKSLLNSDPLQVLAIVHFPWEEGHRAECVEVANGLKLCVCQGKLWSTAVVTVATIDWAIFKRGLDYTGTY